MLGHNIHIAAGEPSPPCQHVECHRRAQFMYTDQRSGLRVYRPWCRPHRPGAGGDVTARPRVYLPEGQAWPDDVKCPHCDRAREPRGDGPRRATCRPCRGLGAVPVPPPAPRPVRRPKTMKRRPKPMVARVTGPTFDPFVFRDGNIRHEVIIPKKDQGWLRKLFEADAGHYSASTSTKLTRRYPTAMVSALWSQWASLQK